ncbi:MAG: hypothetical protein R2847_10150 [Bacteroidia bacterium]
MRAKSKWCGISIRVKEDVEAVNAVLTLSTLTNGMLNGRACKSWKRKQVWAVADPWAKAAKMCALITKDYKHNHTRYSSGSALWSGLMNNGRCRCAYL